MSDTDDRETLAELLSWTSGEMTHYSETAHPDHNHWSWRGTGHGAPMRRSFLDQAEALLDGGLYVHGSKALEARELAAEQRGREAALRDDLLDELDALRAAVERCRGLADEWAHPDPDLIVAFERAIHRNMAGELRHALNGCPECNRAALDGPQDAATGGGDA